MDRQIIINDCCMPREQLFWFNRHLFEGRYTPTKVKGKRESHNIYAKSREECEEKLAEMIAEVKAQIEAEKEKITGWPKTVTLSKFEVQ